ncbi:MAG TPA: hypothetical protein VNQ77_06985 [Frankiaceae bacterium]|nr:hypothetical protein [Frankiaceae bacterium]
MEIGSSIPTYAIGTGLPRIAVGASVLRQVAEIAMAARRTLWQMERQVAQALQALAGMGQHLAAALTMWLPAATPEPVTLEIDDAPLVPVPLHSQLRLDDPARFLRDAVQPNAPSDVWHPFAMSSPGVAV